MLIGTDTARRTERKTPISDRVAKRAKPRGERGPVSDALARHAVRLLEVDCEYRPHPDYDDPQAVEEILGEVAFQQSGDPPRRGRKRPTVQAEGFSQDLALLCNTPLLAPEQEVALFRKMNYLKCQASRLQARLDTSSQREVWALDWFIQEADRTRDRIIHANTRLVVSIAKRYVDAGTSFEELFSEGIVSLMRAVEKYDYAKGNRFSTYATTAIRNNIHHLVRKKYQDRNRFRPSDESVFDSVSDPSAPRPGDGISEFEQLRMALDGLLDQLDPQQRTILHARFGMMEEAKPQTLKEIATAMGVSRERVRQIQLSAIRRLRELADAEDLLPQEGVALDATS